MPASSSWPDGSDDAPALCEILGIALDVASVGVEGGVMQTMQLQALTTGLVLVLVPPRPVLVLVLVPKLELEPA